MVESGTTISWEAWDHKYKPNQDWNHAWGAAPANLLPRFVLRVRPLQPGWGEALIAPQPSGLEHASGRIPTPRGAIEVQWTAKAGFVLKVNVPESIQARVILPAGPDDEGVRLNGKKVPAQRKGSNWAVKAPISGFAVFETY